MRNMFLLFPSLLLLVSCGKSASDKASDMAGISERHHELCDNWFNSEQTEEATTPFIYLGLDGKLDLTFAEEVDQYCKVLKGSTKEF